MILSAPKVDFNVKIIGDVKNSTPLIFLHGFMGSMESWNEIVPHFNTPIILINLAGHGKSHFNNVDNYLFSDWNNDFKSILGQLEITQINLCGYSMGGRLALSFACEYPQIVNRLILESTTAGIIDESEREKRIGEDLLNMAEINKDYLAFVKKWSHNQLFINQKKEIPEVGKHNKKSV